MKTRRLLALLLSVCMLVGVIPAQAYAAFVTDENGDIVPTASLAENGGTLVGMDAEGNETEIEYDPESWEAVYPYGAFAFSETGLTVEEGAEDEAVIKVYRLGGTSGKATAYITYQPVVTQNEDGEPYYGYAISANDLDILVEEPQPIAAYQAVGKTPEPEATEEKIDVATDEEGYVLSVSEDLAGVHWQVTDGYGWNDVFAEDGVSKDVGSSISLDAEYYDEYDFRVIFTDENGTEFCTDSAKGEAYVKEEDEEPLPWPEDDEVELIAEPVYTPLDLRSEEAGPYDGWAFELIFAENEWVKEIHISTKDFDDDLPEAAKGAMFTIEDCYGGEVLEAANTMLLYLADNDDSGENELGFEVSEIVVDKAESTAEIYVTRTGDSTRPVTIAWNTVDGTAVSGTDYVEASGNLLFYTGLETLPIKIELIDDGQSLAEEDALYFDIELSELLGDDLCTMTADTARVYLWNSATGEGDNLASLLYDPNAVDASGMVKDADTVVTDGTVITGHTVEIEAPEETVLEMNFGFDDELDTQVATDKDNKRIVSQIKFTGGTWTKTVDFASVSTNWKLHAPYNSLKDYNDTTDHLLDRFDKEDSWGCGNRGNYTFKNNSNLKGVALVTKGDCSARLEDYDYIDSSNNKVPSGATSATILQMFGSFKTSFLVAPSKDRSYYVKPKDYRYSYSLTRVSVITGGTTKLRAPRYINRIGSGAGDAMWMIYCADSDFTKASDGDNPYKYNYDDTSYNNAKFNDIDADFYSGSTLQVILDIPYQGSDSHCQDTLFDYSLIHMRKFEMQRRTFDGEFSLEIATPNDHNAVSGSMAELTSYTGFIPTVTYVGGQDGGHPFVGSTVTITAGNSLPSGYYIAAVEVYQDAAKTGNFTKTSLMPVSIDSGKKKATITLISGNGTSSGYLSNMDLAAHYRFRVIYARTTQIFVDIAPSVPRLESDATGKSIDTTKINQALSGYTDADKVNYGFSSGTGVASKIKVYSNKIVNGDYTSSLDTYVEITKPTTASAFTSSKDSCVWSFEATNVQKINFGLPHDDLLLINGRTYAGDEDIYLTVANLSGGLSVLYYNKSFQSAISAMTTFIKWMAVYWDANGNGRIDGYYNTDDNNFILEPFNGVYDEACGYIESFDSINETQLAPKKNADGEYCDYFIKVCYTMTPRALVMPEGCSETDRAQILPAFYTSIPETASAYSELTDEQKAYRYIISGMAEDSKGVGVGDYKRSSDNHIMYTSAANSARTIDIPLGGDHSPAVLHEATGTTKAYYTWNPRFFGNMLYPFAAPQPITITNSVAGPTEITDKYVTDSETGETEYSGDGLSRMNGYLGSFTGNTTFVIVSQEQNYTTEEILAKSAAGVTLGGGASNVSDDQLYVMGTEEEKPYTVTPDSVTLGGYCTTPDTEYLKATDTSGDTPASDIDMDSDEDNEMPEFGVDLGINLGDFEIAVTDYLTIAVNEKQVGFSLSLPLCTFDENGLKDKFKDLNKDNWTKFKNFFDKASGFGDDSYKEAKHDKFVTDMVNDSYKKAGRDERIQKDPSKYKSKNFEVKFTIGLAFLWEYNPLDNGYYFEGMTVSLTGELTFRIQARLTVCPIVYFYMQLGVKIELTTGLGVIRDSVELAADDIYSDIEHEVVRSGKEGMVDHFKQQFDYSSAANYNQKLKKVYYTPISKATGSIIVSASTLSGMKSAQQANYKVAFGSYYMDGKNYDTLQKAVDAYFEMGKFYISDEMYQVLTALEGANLTGIKAPYASTKFAGSGEGYYYNTSYASYAAAKDAYMNANSLIVDLDYKAFNLRFDGKVSVTVIELTKDDNTVINNANTIANYGFVSGLVSSDGSDETQIVVRKQDGMLLTDADDIKSAKVIIRAMDDDAKNPLDVTYLIKYAQIHAITNDVYWKGVKIAPEIAIEAGAGVGVELLKLELYLHINVGAEFLLGVYNTAYNPNDYRTDNDQKYKPASVESFEAGIGIGLRVVVLLFTFELDACSYNISYDGDKWEHGWTFLNGWVQDASELDYLGVKIRAPKATYQQAYTPAENGAEPEEDELSTQSVVFADIPFELTSQKGSVSASVLTDGAMSGSDYRVFSVGDRDFVVYTMSRDSLADIDASMLVLSELKLSGGKYGLINPIDSTSPQNYIVVDDDDTGDLDFDVATTTTGAAITWVSYGAEAGGAAIKPAAAVYTATTGAAIGTPMTIENYDETYMEPTSSDSSEVRENFTAWYNYFHALVSSNANAQAQLAAASKDAFLKQATLNISETNTNLTAPATLYGDGNGIGDTINYIFTPTSDGNAIAFGTPIKLDSTSAVYYGYVEYLISAGVLDFSGHAKMTNGYGDYLKQVKKSKLDVFGTQSALCMYYGGNVYQMALGADNTLGNIELLKKGDVYYIAYTTTNEMYMTVSGDEHEMLTATKLYLVTFDTTSKTFGTPYLIRTVHDYDQNKYTDGVYESTAIKAPYDSPYITNLQFLTANIDPEKLTNGEEISTMAVGSHSFLLFEMNGTTYLILDSSLESITTGNGGTMYPFFSGIVHENVDGTKVTETASGKQDVTIGVDANGNAFAIYTSAVQNAGGNALWLSMYDATTGAWGEGTILAMNDLDVYEVSFKYSWNDDIQEAAYLGIGTNGLTDTELEHLYGEEGAKIKEYLEGISVDSTHSVADLGKKESFSFSAPKALAGQNGDLLIVTGGTLTELAVTNTSGTDYTIMPKYDSDGFMSTTNGVYVVSYGKGEPKLGEASLAFSFGYSEFSAGSYFGAVVEATNTGDTAIIYDTTSGQPIVAELYLDDAVIAPEDKVLATWEIEENILSGQTVSLAAYTKNLTQDLPTGTTFNLKITDSNGHAYTVTKLFTIQGKPDLGIENLEVSIASVSSTETVLNVSFDATNRGSGDADGVFVQFQYGEGTGTEVEYSALNITKNTLKINPAKAVPELQTQAVQDGLSQGKLYIYNESDGNNTLEAGYYRHVKGTITVPAAVFTGGESDYLDLKLEIFSDASSIKTMSAGALGAEHNEYYSANNLMTQGVSAITTYTVAPSIVIPLGTTTLIPITAVSSRGTSPLLTATEINDVDGINIGILNFKQTSPANGGSISGVISITPTAIGNGVIHVTDSTTGSVVPIAFIVTAAAEGIDIYNDNGAFTFYDKNGTVANESNSYTGWEFRNVQSWGLGAALKESPMRENLATGVNGSYFTFNTVAESFQLWVDGSVSVESDYPAFMGTKLTGVAGNSPVTVKLGLPGSNASYEAHSVTIRVTSDKAVFDRLVEVYPEGQVPVPSYDGSSPLLIWSRNFPDTASISNSEGTSIPLTVYAFDNGGLQTLTITDPTGKSTSFNTGSTETAVFKMMDGKTNRLWSYSFGNISANGNYNISLTDNGSNTITTDLIVDWFIDGTPKGNTATVVAPGYDSDFYIADAKWDGSAIGSSKISDLDIRFSENSGNTKTANKFTVTNFNEEDQDFMAVAGDNMNFDVTTGNGYYWTICSATDNTWTAEVLYMDKIDSEVPMVSLTFNPETNQIEWKAYKSSSSPSVIKSVTINGIDVKGSIPNGTTVVGAIDIAYNGDYEISATDTAGNVITLNASYNAFGEANNVTDLALNLDACSITPDRVWNQARDNGSIAIDLNGIYGSKYVNSPITGVAFADYYGEYEVSMYRLPDAVVVDPGTIAVNVEDITGYAEMTAEQKDAAEQAKWQELYDAAVAAAVVQDAANLADAKADAESSFVLIDGTTLTYTYSDLTPGEYIVFVRDKNDVANRKEFSIIVEDKAISTDTYTSNSSMSSMNDGGIMIVVNESDTPTVNYAVLLYDNYIEPKEGEPATVVDEALFKSLESTENPIVWMAADNDAMSSAITIENMLYGWYVIAVRGAYFETGNTAQAELNTASEELLIAQADLNAKENALEIAKDDVQQAKVTVERTSKELDETDPTAETYAALQLAATTAEADLAAAETALTTAETDYETAKTTLASKESALAAKKSAAIAAVDAFYAANPEYAGGIEYKLVYIGAEPVMANPSNIASVSAGDDTVVFTLVDTSKDLNEFDCAKIISTNKNNNVVITGDGLSIYIPEGTLKKLDVDTLNDMIVDPANARDGMVIRYTDEDGNSIILPWGLVDDGSVSYLMLGRGKYELVNNEVEFTDIAGLWGEEGIKFCARRNLFAGVGNGLFGPERTMTRAMMVTVFWNIDGQEMSISESPFNDLTAAWYKYSVAWAAKNDITGGVAEGKFAPDRDVTREQMCVFFVKFMDYLGLDLDPVIDPIEFTDKDEISAWAADFVDYCTSVKLISGMGNNRFAPAASATRMQVCALMDLFITNIVGQYCPAPVKAAEMNADQ